MHHVHQHPIRSSLLAGTVVMAVGLFGSASAAYAVPCTLTPATGSAVQTETTVTGGPAHDTIDCRGASPGKTITGGPGNDTIIGTASNDTISGDTGNDTITGLASADNLNGGLGIDIISGSEDDDILVGPSTDGVQDKLDGGLNTDTCQGPAPDPDSLASCENQVAAPLTGPGSSTASATELCEASGGQFVSLGPLAYNCLRPTNRDYVDAAESNCTQSGALIFVDPPLYLLYSCVLPGQTLLGGLSRLI
jgi:hypothetical protein